MNNNYLDKNVINDFRNVLNSSPIFYAEKEHKKNWNLICAMMDRVDSAVNYINKFDISHFDTEESFINFLTYCCMLNDSVVQLFNSIDSLNNFYKTNIKEQSKYFKQDYENFIKIYDENSQETTCSDDKFFEFIRSIAFAHPLDTNRQKFIKTNDKLVSPFVLVNNIFGRDIINPIGIAIYTLVDDKTIHLWFSVNHIIEYLENKYSLFKKAIGWFAEQISNYSKKWAQRKVQRDLNNVALLKNIKEILNERHCDTFYIDETIELLECEVSDIRNKVAVEKYKKELVKTFSSLCDWVDSLQDENFCPNDFYDMLDPRPKVLYPQAHYELGKIFSYLDDSIINFKTYITKRDVFIRTNGKIDVSNFEWGLLQAENFFNVLGKQYLHFDLSQLQSATEVKLLTRTALFLEQKKQSCGQISKSLTKLNKEYNIKMKNNKAKEVLKIKFPNKEDIIVSFVDASSNKEKKS